MEPPNEIAPSLKGMSIPRMCDVPKKPQSASSPSSKYSHHRGVSLPYYEKVREEVRIQEQRNGNKLNVDSNFSELEQAVAKFNFGAVPESLKSNFTCVICFEDEGLEKVTLACSHFYCRWCLQRSIVESLMQGKTDLRCADPSCSHASWDFKQICDILVPQDGFFHSFDRPIMTYQMGENVLDAYQLVEKYVRFHMIVTANKSEEKTTAACTNLDCDGILIFADAEGLDQENVDCRLCSLSHCLKCATHHQEGETCKQAMKRWRKEKYLNSDKYKRKRKRIIAARAILPTIATRMSLAIQPNVKRCPNCHRFIKKYFGCKHMYCSACGKDFCWECMHVGSTYGIKHCRMAKVTWPVRLLVAATFSAVYVPVMVLPWAVYFGAEKALRIPKDERSHLEIWKQFYFWNEAIAGFPY